MFSKMNMMQFLEKMHAYSGTVNGKCKLDFVLFSKFAT